jgi:predicted nucleic acid-binding protein
LRIYFFDTSAIIPRYHAGAFTAKVNRILATPESQFYVCELSVVEVSSALAQFYRKHQLTVADFHTMRGLFEDDIANGLLNVLPIAKTDLLNARDLLEDAAVLKKRNLRSADAIIAASCRELAHTQRTRVIFYTKDWTQYSSIYDVQAYRAALKLRFLGKGKGGIPAHTG